jgi:DNA polymerase III, beta subunit
MKLSFQKNNLLSGINTVSKAVPSKTTMSILECILIQALDGIIKFTANDMDLGIETVIDGVIHERGKIAVDAKLFSEIIRKLPDDNINITADNNFNVNITCGKSKFNIQGKSGEDFVALPYIEKDKYISLSQFTLRETIKQTIFSIAPADNNKLMTGELFEINENILRIVGLDGHRIAIRKVELSTNYEDIKVVVPGKTLSELTKILSGEIEDEVLIFFSSNTIVFEFNNTVVVSRLIDGEYFKIDQMLSNDYETKVIINKKEFLYCIDRASLLIRESDKKPVIMNIEDKNIKLKLNSSIGSMDEDISIDKYGSDIIIGFNPRFLIDALKVIDEEEITLYMINSKAPCFIKDDNEKYIYLILPVNFNVD